MAADWSLLEQKRALRRAMRTARERLLPAERARASRAVAAALECMPELAGARVVSSFFATRGEIDLSRFVEGFQASGMVLVYPRVCEDRPRLRFHPVFPESQLRTSALGILEPLPDGGEIPLDAIDVLLVPGLAFDARGHRLGYGGGYYDETGALVRAAGRGGILIGVGFDFQLVESCPTGVGDVNVDFVVTDGRIVRCDGKQLPSI